MVKDDGIGGIGAGRMPRRGRDRPGRSAAASPAGRLHDRRRFWSQLLAVALAAGALPAVPAWAAGEGAGAAAALRVSGQGAGGVVAGEQEKERLGDDPAAAEADFIARRFPLGLAPGYLSVAARYLAARDRMSHMAHHRSASGPAAGFGPDPDTGAGGTVPGPGGRPAAAAAAWQALGPGNLGGRTRALVVDPARPRTVYAGGVDGGVWQSLDGGASWQPLGDLLPSLAVASLAMDPADPSVLYAGTGEGFFNADAVRGAGIFKTTDGGGHWQQLAATATPDFYAVNRLLISARSHAIYAATGTGVWRSADGGATWSQRLAPGVEGGCLDLAMRGDQADDVVFASCGTFQQATVYRNLRAEKAARFLPVLQAPGMGRTSLAIAPSNQNVIYALAASNLPGPNGHYSQGLLAVFRSTAGGAAGSWTTQVSNSDPVALNTALLSSTRFAFQKECGTGPADTWSGRGWYDNAVAVDPLDPDRVWAGGVDLFRSDDGGRNWGIANYWWAGENGAAGGFAHADVHAIVFGPRYDGDANQVLYLAGDGGLYRTANARAAVATGTAAPCDTSASAVSWTSLDNGFAVTQFYQGAVSADGATWIGGTQDLGTVLGGAGAKGGAAGAGAAGGMDGWVQVIGQDGGYVAIDPANALNVYAESDGLSLARSTDGGHTFALALDGITSGTFPFLVPFALDPLNPLRLWLGGDSLWTTADGAAHWSRASFPLGDNALDLTSAIAISAHDDQLVVAGTSQGTISRNDAALAATPGSLWAAAHPADGLVSSLVFDPQAANTLYATYATFGAPHLWQSLDGGATWHTLDGSGVTGLPDLPAHALAIDPRHTSHLYLGTDLGVFVSVDSGQTWSIEDTGFANVVVDSLVIAPAPPGNAGSASYLFAFTHGRGAWRLQLPD